MSARGTESAAPEVAEVYYDGQCPYCRAEVAWLRPQPGLAGTVFADVTDPAVPVPPGLDRQAAIARFHVRLADGRIVGGARAFLAVAAGTRWRPLARALDRQPFVALLDLAYALYLRLRPLWRKRAG